VMLGVTMSDADAVTLKRLGIEDKEGIFIDTVIDGLPAAKAGLQPNDLIVAINGEKDPSQEELRKVLREKKPGETINLKIHRKGESKDLTVTLEAYEPGKLGHDAFGGGPAEGGQGMLWVPGEERDWDQFPGQVWDFGMEFDKDEVRDAINEALESLREEAGDLGKVKEEATRELERALAELDKHKGQLRELANLYRDRAGGMAPRIRLFNDRGVLPPDAPPAPAAPPASVPVPTAGSSTLDRIAEQLDRLNSRLDALEKRLDEKK
jgi:SHS2 domain-containing protein